MVRAFAFGKDIWDPTHRFETSWLLPPFVLFLFRAAFALYAFVVLVFVLGWYCGHEELGGCAQSRDEFSYFTVLTYWGLAFYFAVAAAHTLSYALAGVSLIDRLPRPLQALHSLFYTSVTVYPFIVTGVYWGVLYSGSWFTLEFNAWSNVSQHAMNSVFALFEILVTRTAPQPWIHLLWLIALLALYLALAYVTRATKGFYVYSFLDPGTSGSGIVAAYVFGIAAACCVVYLLVKGLIALRLWLTEEKMGMRGKFSRRDTDAGGGGAAWRRSEADDAELAQLSERVDKVESAGRS